MNHALLKSVIYDQHEFIRNFQIVPRDYEFEENGNYVLVGLRRAGKSTLLSCLTLLERPTSGQIMLAGQDIASLSGAQLRAARRGMGVVFQGYNLLMQKTVAENVAFPLRLERGYDKAAVQARVAELLAIVGRVPGPAFRRTEAARGHRPRAGHTARDAAV